MRTQVKRKTKIVATLGPSSSSREVIRGMIDAGMDVVRLNFSHGTHEDHLTLYEMVRDESQKAGKHVAIFQDLCGPKLRIRSVQNGSVTLKDDSIVELIYRPKEEAEIEGDESQLYISIFNPGKVMRRGERALLADGRVELIAEEVLTDSVRCRVLAGGTIRSRVGIAVPESKLDLPCLTEKDIFDLAWAVEHKVDYVALSFVGSPKDIADIRAEMRKLNASIPVIAKIERAGALDHISDIVEVADAAMVARGDLGLELPIERVPSAQRLIISSANYAGVPVITATQMLMSMVEQIRPTRAEVTDVSTAVRDGTDAVMLSDETAIGKHPVQVVRVLARILAEAERELALESSRSGIKSKDRSKVADAVCYAACNAAEKISASAMIACTHSGYTARLMAKYRPSETLFGATSQRHALARMSLYWGVQPVLINVPDNASIEEEVTAAMVTIRDEFGFKPGSRVVITAGLRTRVSGTTNVMEIRDIPRAS